MQQADDLTGRVGDRTDSSAIGSRRSTHWTLWQQLQRNYGLYQSGTQNTIGKDPRPEHPSSGPPPNLLVCSVCFYVMAQFIMV